ncbi:hypothetical protein OYT1_ch2298 [Ferriphaselus amnicola]|uniref:Uncharacterized protein n=1 Tax=Ferriphaselus amnicola TaxID=1188319 RepID=A0A2Z6GEZ6_9PROT|nr:hypothetical protein [Ferriphaselus amnicola]BBE51814.1 hypothetical protein OYT1_ch2298 [Ferriphaselus amnicola]
MAKLSTATEHALSVIAHASMAKDVSRNVEGMGGFYEFWLKDQSPKDRDLIESYLKLSKAAYKDKAAMLAKDVASKNG